MSQARHLIVKFPKIESYVSIHQSEKSLSNWHIRKSCWNQGCQNSEWSLLCSIVPSQNTNNVSILLLHLEFGRDPMLLQ